MPTLNIGVQFMGGGGCSRGGFFFHSLRCEVSQAKSRIDPNGWGLAEMSPIQSCFPIRVEISCDVTWSCRSNVV